MDNELAHLQQMGRVSSSESSSIRNELSRIFGEPNVVHDAALAPPPPPPPRPHEPTSVAIAHEAQHTVGGTAARSDNTPSLRELCEQIVTKVDRLEARLITPSPRLEQHDQEQTKFHHRARRLIGRPKPRESLRERERARSRALR